MDQGSETLTDNERARAEVEAFNQHPDRYVSYHADAALEKIILAAFAAIRQEERDAARREILEESK